MNTYKRKIGKGGLQFSKAQKELAEQIANDISEDIDNGNTKPELRMAVDYWVEQCQVEVKRRVKMRSDVLDVYTKDLGFQIWGPE